jgi:hypothetical protein
MTEREKLSNLQIWWSHNKVETKIHFACSAKIHAKIYGIEYDFSKNICENFCESKKVFTFS